MEFLLWMRSQWMPPASTCMESHLFHNFYHGKLLCVYGPHFLLGYGFHLAWGHCNGKSLKLICLISIELTKFVFLSKSFSCYLFSYVLLCYNSLSGWWPMCTQSHSLFPITCIVSSIPQTSFSFLSWEVHFSMCDNDLLL